MTFAVETLVMRLRLMAFRNILRQPIGWFDLPLHTSGRLVSRLAKDAPLIKGVSPRRSSATRSGSCFETVEKIHETGLHCCGFWGLEKAVEWNGVTSKLIKVENGVPRGSVVTLLLFVVSTLLNSITGGSTAEMWGELLLDLSEVIELNSIYSEIPWYRLGTVHIEADDLLEDDWCWEALVVQEVCRWRLTSTREEVHHLCRVLFQPVWWWNGSALFCASTLNSLDAVWQKVFYGESTHLHPIEKI